MKDSVRDMVCSHCSQSTKSNDCPNCGNEQFCDDCNTCNICGPVDLVGHIKNQEVKLSKVVETYAVREIDPLRNRSGYKYALVSKTGLTVGFFKEVGEDLYQLIKIAKDNPAGIHLHWRIKNRSVERVEI